MKCDVERCISRVDLKTEVSPISLPTRGHDDRRACPDATKNCNSLKPSYSASELEETDTQERNIADYVSALYQMIPLDVHPVFTIIIIYSSTAIASRSVSLPT